MNMKIIDEQLLNGVAEEAKKSPRLRKNYNFHQSLQDKCHRFLNALEPGTFIPVHHHPDKDETFVILRGKVRVTTYNDEGEIAASCILSHESGRYGVDIPKNVWHGLECLEPSVLLECKAGPFVEHEVAFKDCVFNVTADKYYLFKLSHLDDSTNARHELAEKCLPNVTIKNMTVNTADGAKEFLIFSCGTGGKELTDVGGLTKIDINGLKINAEGGTPLSRISLSNVKMQTKRAVDCQMNDVIVNQPEQGFLSKVLFSDEATMIANMTLKGGIIMMKNVKNLKQ